MDFFRLLFYYLLFKIYIYSTPQYKNQNVNVYTSFPFFYYADIASTEPPQLPGRCPEPKKSKVWIPFRGHCYAFIASRNENWAHASVECMRMGTHIWGFYIFQFCTYISLFSGAPASFYYKIDFIGTFYGIICYVNYVLYNNVLLF